MSARPSLRLVWIPVIVVAAFALGRLTAPRQTSEVALQTAEVSPESKPLPELLPVAVTPRPVATIATPDAWEHHWQELAARPASRLREQEVIVIIEELASRDPDRALALAAVESNMRFRLEMYRAALRGWGKTSSEAAADWVLSGQNAIEKNDGIAAVLTGAVKNPDAAIQFTTHLMQKDPEQPRNHGVALIAALSNVGEFEKAARFAATAGEDNREDWMTTTYSMWADYQPTTALAALESITDPQERQTAFNAAITSWSGNDPKAVVEYAAALNAGGEKKFAITVALQHWAANDPVEAAHWIRQLDPTPELDAGAASVATDFHNFRQPSDAVEWAESITDLDLRSSTLVTVIREWASRDSVAAQNYLKNTKQLRQADRFELLADFANIPANKSTQ